VPDAQREQLHQFAREVLVRMRGDVARIIEIDEHRRVLRDRAREFAQIAQRAVAEELVLRVDHRGRDALLHRRRRKVAVEVERHALLQRRGRREHAVEPPQLQRRRRGQFLLADALLDRLALGQRQIPQPARAVLLQVAHGAVDVLGSRQRRGRRETHQRLHRLPDGHAGVFGNIVLRGAEAGATQQVRGATLVERAAIGFEGRRFELPLGAEDPARVDLRLCCHGVV
jgi:hypothetical protein